mmetsp:Transcript_71/g.137  ORF Transcript_71/g.137 Transcript_71/m.137 type:complete len:331 (-) Transcript_71:498-1490(-)
MIVRSFLFLLSGLLIIMTKALSVQKVAVIGATGKLGRTAVQQLVDQGIQCKLLLRSSSKKLDDGETPETPSLTAKSSKEEVVSYLTSLPGVSTVQGDVGNVFALTELLSDCEACLALFGSTRRSAVSDIWNKDIENDPSHAKQINYQGVANILTAARTSSTCRRIVRITGKGEDPTSIFTVLINMLGSMAKAWNYEGERLLRGQSDVEYTIVRPGVMSEDGPTTGFALADDGGDLKVGRVSYSSIAALCIASLNYDNVARSTLTAMTVEEGEGASSWEPLLEKVQPDRRSFPTDMLEQHKAAVKNALIKLGVVGGVFVAIFVQFVIRLFS